MKSVFEDIKLEWRGEPYVIPANRVLGAIARVEEFFTLGELTRDARDRNSVPMSKLASAYGAVLRYAGASVTNEEVYEELFQKTSAPLITSAIQGLLMMMIPPSALRREAEAADKREGRKAKKSRRQSGSSRLPTGQQ